MKKFIKLSVRVRHEILLEKFENACGLQHFCITWIYLVQNCAVYKEFNKLAMIDGMATATCLIDCHMNTMIKTFSLSLKSRIPFLYTHSTRAVPRIFLEGQNSSSGLKFSDLGIYVYLLSGTFWFLVGTGRNFFLL